MSILVFDQTMIGKLKTVVGDTAEIRDERGVLWGYFKPVVSPETVDQYECPVSEEELDSVARGGAEGGRWPTFFAIWGVVREVYGCLVQSGRNRN